MRLNALLLIVSWLTAAVSAFVLQPAAIVHKRQPLFMSDVPQGDKDKDSNNNMLPSTTATEKAVLARPEDMFTMTGDFLCLSIYGFVDHFLTHDISSYMVSHAHYHPMAHLPVWVSPHNLYACHQVFDSTLRDRLIVEYSWMFQDTGMAVVLLCTSWLVAGLLNEAFLFKNSLHCRTEITLLTTLTTWMTSTGMLLMLLGVLSDRPTAGDIYFIVDSLTVLTLWRFLASSLFGSTKE